MPILTPQERIGTTLDGKYRVEKILGIGGMGSVYAGTHTITGRRVAVKILHPEHATSADVMERFFREARTASEIKHPNVVDVLDMGTDPEDKTVFLVLELLEGESLARRLKREKKLHYAQAAEVLLPVMRALAFAHGRRVVHRDLKPDNIFLGAEPSGGTTTKLLDFGIAKALDRNESRMTQTGFVLGTPAYMSPEQAAGDPDDITPASDIWSMGVVWYECLTGEMPFEGASPTATLIAIANGRYHHLRRRMPDLPLAIAHAVDKALAKDPARRHADMDAFIQSLQRGLENPEERAAATEPPPTTPQTPEGPREHWSFGPPRAFATQPPTERSVALAGEPEVSQRTPPSIVVSTPSPARRWGLLAGVLGAVALAGTAAFMITYDSDMPASRTTPSARAPLTRPPAPTPPPQPTPTVTTDASTEATVVTTTPAPTPAPTPTTESESHGSHRSRHGRERHDESPAIEPAPTTAEPVPTTAATPPQVQPRAVDAPREAPTPETPAPAPRPSSPHEPITTYESTP